MKLRDIITLDPELAARLTEHAVYIAATPEELVDELVRNYLNGTGPYAEVSEHLGTINRLGVELEQLAKQARAVVDSLPRHARTYDTAADKARGPG